MVAQRRTTPAPGCFHQFPSPGVGRQSLELTPVQEKLFHKHIYVVQKVIGKLLNTNSRSFLRQLGEDANSVGLVALCPRQKFRPELGFAFEVYVTRAIEMLPFL